MKKFLFVPFIVIILMLSAAFSGFATNNVVFKEVSALATGERSLGDIADSVSSSITNIWNYKITTMDKRPIAVSNVMTGIILFILGLWAARYLSRFIGRKVFSMLNLEQSVADALEKFSYYLFVILMTLLVLDISNVPLKVFTFVGGALAIGIGFGSQNIINNFISGLILMVERPIRIGDLVEVNNMLGRVISIGARCTHLRTGNSVDILLPNSSMLEKTVVNWTLNDNIVRVNISIGVMYNTPTYKVESALLRAIKQIPDILSVPTPQVYFTAFGENALQFEAHFWIELSSPIEKIRIISNLNHTIDILFRESGIIFAHPQRDIYIKSPSIEPVTAV